MKNKLVFLIFVLGAMMGYCTFGLVVDGLTNQYGNISRQLYYDSMHNTSSTGIWMFVQSDGITVTRKWSHNESTDWTTHSQVPWDYVKETKNSGILIIWWDINQKRIHSISQWLKGKENGFKASWYPSGKVLFTGNVVDDYYITHVLWNSDGTILEIKTRTAYIFGKSEDAALINGGLVLGASESDASEAGITNKLYESEQSKTNRITEVKQERIKSSK